MWALRQGVNATDVALTMTTICVNEEAARMPQLMSQAAMPPPTIVFGGADKAGYAACPTSMAANAHLP